jgi:hypothetical protein
MTKRRDFIRTSLIGTAGIAFGGLGEGSSGISLLFDPNEQDKKVIPELNPIVEKEEDVYQYIPADNGAGPMWCHGSSSIVRLGKELYASGLETIPGMKPLNNCRWMLFERSKKGWVKKLTDMDGRTREPSPMAAFHDGRIFLSANPTLTAPDTYNGPARPELLQFKKSDEKMKFKRILPVWEGDPPFTEHSYRSLAADGNAGELILFQNIEYTHAEWSFLDSKGKWSSHGKLQWPFGSDNEEPGPIRVCYPNVMLKDRAVYFCGVSDIIEPRKEWRKFKQELTGKEWDYDFRRLFFTWSDNIITGKFHSWIEIASREATCGWIFPSDLWVSPDGSVHILWTERAIDERLREKYFPEAKQSHALNYAIVRNGQVEVRRTIAIAEEGKSNEIPGFARFQITPENRLFVVYFMTGTDASGSPVAENKLVEIMAGGNPGTPVILPLKKPLSSFFSATVRAGSKPSSILDLLGTPSGVKNTISYASIRLW